MVWWCSIISRYDTTLDRNIRTFWDIRWYSNIIISNPNDPYISVHSDIYPGICYWYIVSCWSWGARESCLDLSRLWEMMQQNQRGSSLLKGKLYVVSLLRLFLSYWSIYNIIALKYVKYVAIFPLGVLFVVRSTWYTFTWYIWSISILVPWYVLYVRPNISLVGCELSPCLCVGWV